MNQLVVVALSPMSKRLGGMLGRLFAETDVYTAPLQQLPTLRGKRILFALSLDEYGQNPEFPKLIRMLRSQRDLLEGSVVGMIIDSEGELYTKSTATTLAFAANRAGAIVVGRPLVEGVAQLQNYSVQSRVRAMPLEDCYLESARELCDRLVKFSPTRRVRPRLLVIHASNHKTSNTMDAWRKIESYLEGIDITEVGLRNGTVDDCSGCPHTMCMHFGEARGCFYGGVMVGEVYPAVMECDAVLMLCPNYNDAMSANLTAFVNRLTALYRQTPFFDKAIFAVVVSGYSGSDVVASQIISGLCMNKAFAMPPHAIMTEIANAPGELLQREQLSKNAENLANEIKKYLIG